MVIEKIKPSFYNGIVLTINRDLYILGLREMQQLDQNDPESFFQVAGEHSPVATFMQSWNCLNLVFRYPWTTLYSMEWS